MSKKEISIPSKKKTNIHKASFNFWVNFSKGFRQHFEVFAAMHGI